MRIIISDIQGFMIDNEFFAKELSFVVGNRISHFILKLPRKFSTLTRKDRNTVRYLENKHHGLKYNSGYIEYDRIPWILKDIIRNGDIIYVNGHQKYEIIRNT